MQFKTSAKVQQIFLHIFTKINQYCYVCLHNKNLMSFQNCFGVLSRLCQGKGWKSFSHFKCLREQHSIN